MKIFKKELLIKGKPTSVDCVKIEGQTYTISKGLLKVVALEEEWYEDVMDPNKVIHALKEAPFRADIFTFWQRFPDTTPRFDYYHEFEAIAVLSIQTYDHWFRKQINAKTRNMVRKAEKKGVKIRLAEFSDDFVRGMTEIFNESPVRQGKRFWHYGKDFHTVKEQFSKYLFREYLIGAYYNGELIGFMMIANAGGYALIGQILSKIKHRDKAINNALVAKAVDTCAEQGFPYLIYYYWGTGSFSAFKRRSGFEKVFLPRYFVPLTWRGRLAMRVGLHRGLKEALPDSVREKLKDLRRIYLEYRTKEI